jgi:hypothetical protein
VAHEHGHGFHCSDCREVFNDGQEKSAEKIKALEAENYELKRSIEVLDDAELQERMEDTREAMLKNHLQEVFEAYNQYIAHTDNSLLPLDEKMKQLFAHLKEREWLGLDDKLSPDTSEFAKIAKENSLLQFKIHIALKIIDVEAGMAPNDPNQYRVAFNALRAMLA